MDCDFGVGCGYTIGFALMQATDLNWYQVNITGSNPSASVTCSQAPLTYSGSTALYQDNSIGYQLIQSNDNNIYKVSLSGSSGSAIQIVVSQTPQSNTYDGKPYFLMKSVTDGAFYVVSVVSGSGGVKLSVNQSSKMFLNF